MEKPCTTKANTPKPQSKWSEIPGDILNIIVILTDVKTDVPRARGVCKSWRKSITYPIVKQSTLTVPPLDNQSGHSLLIVTPFYIISPLLGPGLPWLARMTEVCPRKWHLLNPLNAQNYFLSDPRVIGGINLLDFSVVEVAAPWTIVAGLQGGNLKMVSKKVVGGWNFESDYIFAVLAQLELPGHCGEGGLLFKRLDDQEWFRIEGTFDGEDDSLYRILDIAHHKGKFYAFELVQWKVGVIDPKNTLISLEFMAAPDVLGEPVDGMYCVSIDDCSCIVNDVYLVPSNGQLYLIIDSIKVGSTKAIMIVFILNEGKWDRVTSIGDQVLFIGYDVSFGVSCSSKNLTNWKPGSICLFNKPFPMFYDTCSITSRGLPEGAECLKSVSFPEYWRYLRIYYMEEEEKGVVAFSKLPMKEYTGLFFPPPAWVNWRCPSLDNVDVMLHNVTFTEESDTDDLADEE